MIMDNRKQCIDSLKGIGILGVVLVHYGIKSSNDFVNCIVGNGARGVQLLFIINEILIFPSKFFPGVGFGYSNLSIITLERCNPVEAVENTIRIIQGFHSSAEFQYAFDEEDRFPAHIQIYKMKQKDI